MHIIKIKKLNIIKLINIINLIIEKNAIIPILSNFLLIKKKNFIKLIANNIDIQIKIKLNCEINKKKLIIGLSIKNFLNIIKNFPNDIISLKLSKKKKLLIECNKIKFILNTVIVSNYPIAKFKKKNKITLIINQKDLLNLINNIYFAINTKINNPSMNGIFISINKNIITGITTDNYRLAYSSIKLENIDIKKNLIIPSKTIFILKNLLKFNNNKIILLINNKQIKFKFDNIEILSKLILEKFPILKNKLKDYYETNFIIDKNILKFALKRALSIIKDNFYLTKWLIKKNILELITINNNEKCKEELFINYNNKPIKLSLNISYILDVIENIKTEKLQFNFSKNKNNIIIMIPNNNNFKYIITSIKI